MASGVKRQRTTMLDMDLDVEGGSTHSMETRSQRRQQEASQDLQIHTMGPLIAKGPNNEDRYVPWSFMDMITLAGRLTPLVDGADRWIAKLEEITGGINLAAGDIKALLIKTAGHSAAKEVFGEAELSGVMNGQLFDRLPFNAMRPKVWGTLRKKYPSRRDPTKLKEECLKDGESPAQFLHKFQQMWKAETGSEWDEQESTKALFKMYVKGAMPKEVQAKLDGVVGLIKMD
ncbi:uncharacterized protein ACNS7B_007856 [Menidia menidia]